MCITPFFLAALLLHFPHKFLCAAILFAIASVTDAIDGKLARKNNQITVFGKLLDPVADKMLTTAALLGFLTMGYCNVWSVMLILTREFAVTFMRLIASAQGIVIPANIFGKIKTATQMTFSVAILLMGELSETILPNLPVALVSTILIWITTAFAVLSGIIYLWDAKKRIDFSL